jgi:hypothetical protein
MVMEKNIPRPLKPTEAVFNILHEMLKFGFFKTSTEVVIRRLSWIIQRETETETETAGTTIMC